MQPDSEKVISYSEQIIYRECSKYGIQELEKNNYEKAIENLIIADQSISHFTSSAYLAEAYMHLNEKEKALKALAIAFQKGYPIKELDSVLFSDVWDKVETTYFQNIEQYNRSVDTVLRNEIRSMWNADQMYRNNYGINKNKIDSIDKYNINRLRTIVQTKGWPGRKIQGYGFIKSPSIFVIHANELYNLYFLEIAIESAKNNHSNWFDAEAIMQNLLWRFDYSGYIKLRETYLNEDSSLDMEKSFFQLKVLSKFLITNSSRSIELMAFASITNDQFNQKHQSTLKEIKSILVRHGVSPERIVIEQKLQPSASDEFGTYNLGFRY